MKFNYQYRSADNVLHRETIDAPSRDEAFARLKAQGIRPAKVEEAPGFFNKLLGKGKRWLAIVVLALVAVGATVALVLRPVEVVSEEDMRATPRHQIYGDPAVMQEIERGNLDGIFAKKGDQLLAWFAQPGRLMMPAGATLEGGGDIIATVVDEDVEILPADSREVRELKQIVNGIKDELRAYLQNGNGTCRSFWRRMRERLREELSIYNRFKTELENEKDEKIWEERNAALRRLGLRTITAPGEGE